MMLFEFCDIVTSSVMKTMLGFNPDNVKIHWVIVIQMYMNCMIKSHCIHKRAIKSKHKDA